MNRLGRAAASVHQCADNQAYLNLTASANYNGKPILTRFLMARDGSAHHGSYDFFYRILDVYRLVIPSFQQFWFLHETIPW